MSDQRQPTVHELKTERQYWLDVRSGRKPFEVRRDDREGFFVGDVLRLMELDDAGEVTGRWILAVVRYVLPGGRFGVMDGYVVLGIKVVAS